MRGAQQMTPEPADAAIRYYRDYLKARDFDARRVPPPRDYHSDWKGR